MDTARVELNLVYCVFVLVDRDRDELACVFSSEAKAKAYLERLYDEGVDSYYISKFLDVEEIA